MKFPRFVHSSAFRLTLLYAVLFGASVITLLIFIYFAAISEMESQIKSNISIQLADLSRKFITQGERETAATIRARLDKEKEKLSIYLLLDRKWNVVAGNIDRWPGGNPATSEWITFPLYRDDIPQDKWPSVMARNSTLPGGYILLVGYKLTSLERAQEVMVRVMAVSSGVILVLAVMGGMFLSHAIRKKLERINTACARVMSGELKERVAVSGSGDEFDNLAENFNAMLNRIEELIDGIKDISSNIAHDLRTPLGRLRGRLEEMARHASESPSLKGNLHIALNDIDNLTQTFNAILRISQAEIGAGKEQFTPVNLSNLIKDVVDLYEPLAEEKMLSLMTEIESDVNIFGDKPLLTQAIANLVDNGVKYTPAQGTLRLTLKTVNSRPHLWIVDSGMGIPPEFYGKITEKFFRLEKSRHLPGNGLGLSLASAAFKLHEADMQFEDGNPGLVVHIIF